MARGAEPLIARRTQQYLDNLAPAGDVSLARERADAYLRIGNVLGNPALPNLGDTRAALANYEKSLQLNRALTSSRCASLSNNTG